MSTGDHRKSSATRQGADGNVEKYISYSEAWARINEALEEGFYLEAVTIEESIISDRLISYLVGVGAIERENEVRNYPSFYRLIERWREAAPQPVSPEGSSDLTDEVDKWRKQRNYLIHSMVASQPGTPTDRVEDFLEVGKEAAERGEELARAVSKWQDQSR